MYFVNFSTFPALMLSRIQFGCSCSVVLLRPRSVRCFSVMKYRASAMFCVTLPWHNMTNSFKFLHVQSSARKNFSKFRNISIRYLWPNAWRSIRFACLNLLNENREIISKKNIIENIERKKINCFIPQLLWKKTAFQIQFLTTNDLLQLTSKPIHNLISTLRVLVRAKYWSFDFYQLLPNVS